MVIASDIYLLFNRGRNILKILIKISQNNTLPATFATGYRLILTFWVVCMITISIMHILYYICEQTEVLQMVHAAAQLFGLISLLFFHNSTKQLDTYGP